MKMCVFLGPTLRINEARSLLDVDYLPPAGRGDFYRAALDRPMAIGLIDGYFAHTPSVWHKEILWAMSRGIHVFGSASMGALRAAELESFGMEGVGWIFEAFRDGRLSDDDEVAILHGPEDADHVPLTEAMVNIRRTLCRAWESGIIEERHASRIIELGKQTFYQARTYEHLLAGAVRTGIPDRVCEALQAWLPDNKVDQKRADALQMLGLMADKTPSISSPKRVDYRFAHTTTWESLVSSFDGAASGVERDRESP